LAVQTPIPRLPQVGSSLERIGQACEGKPAEALGCVTVMCQRYADEAELETQLRHSLIGFDAPQDFTPSKNFAPSKSEAVKFTLCRQASAPIPSFSSLSGSASAA